MVRRLCLLTAIFMCIGIKAGAQTGIDLSQYYNVRGFFNPAEPGNTDYLNITAGGRLQWIGVDPHPGTFFLSAGMPYLLLNKYHLGGGVKAYYNSYGDTKILYAGAQISYKFHIGDGILSVGLEPAYTELKYSKNLLADVDGNKPVEGEENISQGIVSYSDAETAATKTKLKKGFFNAGAGIYFSTKRWWAGISVQNIVSPKLRDTTVEVDTLGMSSNPLNHKWKYPVATRLYPDIFFMAGCNIPLGHTLFNISPSVFASRYNGYHIGQVDVVGSWKEMLFVGAGYRYKEAVTLSAGFNIKGFRIGYAYDLPAGLRSRNTRGSHEFILGYSMKMNLFDLPRYRYHSIRYL